MKWHTALLLVAVAVAAWYVLHNSCPGCQQRGYAVWNRLTGKGGAQAVGQPVNAQY